MNLKHVGKIRDTQEKVVVLFNEVPNDTDYCLVVKTTTLNSADHEELMRAVESEQGQTTKHLGSILDFRMNQAGRPFFTSLHESGKISKILTDNILLTPNVRTEVVLREINDMVRGQARASGMDDPDTTITNPEQVAQIASGDKQPLTNEDLANNLRKQAEGLQNEAKVLLEQAEELNPTIKKRSTKKKVSAKKTDPMPA